MSLRKKVMVLVIPLILVIAVLSLVGIVSTRNLVFRLNEITHVKIPLASLASRITENQLEQALRFEKSMVFAARGDGQELIDSIREFERLSGSITGALDRARHIAAEPPAGTARPGLPGELKRFESLLADVSSRRARYEQGAREIFELLRRGLPDEVSDSRLAGIQALESGLYETVESLREELSRFAEDASRDVLGIERRVLIFMIIGASFFVLGGLIAFPLLLLFWNNEDEGNETRLPAELYVTAPSAAGARDEILTSISRE